MHCPSIIEWIILITNHKGTHVFMEYKSNYFNSLVGFQQIQSESSYSHQEWEISRLRTVRSPGLKPDWSSQVCIFKINIFLILRLGIQQSLFWYCSWLISVWKHRVLLIFMTRKWHRSFSIIRLKKVPKIQFSSMQKVNTPLQCLLQTFLNF